jgi:hypothetical protein
VRTIVEYAPSSGPPQTVSVTGPPTRVTFDPQLGDVLAQFMARGLAAALSLGDHLLWLFCLALLYRPSRQTFQLLAALVAAQAAGGVAVAVVPQLVASAPLASTIAASALVVAALQNIVRARWSYVLALTVAFGLLNGFTFGALFADASQFSGSHPGIAALAFVFVLAVAELWIGAVFWTVRDRLVTVRVGDGVVTVLASVLVAHTAVHRMIDRGSLWAETGSHAGLRVSMWLALGWTLTMLLVAFGTWLRERVAPGSNRLSSDSPA